MFCRLGKWFCTNNHVSFLPEAVMKDVFKAAKNSSCGKLSLWKDSISNMLWHSFATSSELISIKYSKVLFSYYRN